MIVFGFEASPETGGRKRNAKKMMGPFDLESVQVIFSLEIYKTKTYAGNCFSLVGLEL